jgi:hypothetical protein
MARLALFQWFTRCPLMAACQEEGRNKTVQGKKFLLLTQKYTTPNLVKEFSPAVTGDTFLLT